MDTLFDTYGLSIVHDPANNCLFVTWHGVQSGREKQSCCLLILQKIRQTGSTRLLSDSSQDLDGWTEVTHWLGHDYYQALIDEGIEAIAWVLPHNLRARAAVDKLIHISVHPGEVVGQRPVIDTFQDVESAHSWLQSVATLR